MSLLEEFKRVCASIAKDGYDGKYFVENYPNDTIILVEWTRYAYPKLLALVDATDAYFQAERGLTVLKANQGQDTVSLQMARDLYQVAKQRLRNAMDPFA